MFLALSRSLIPLLNHSYLNEFYICSEAELLKQIYVLVFQANTCLKRAGIIRPVFVKHDKMWERNWCYWLDNREILMLLAEQPRHWFYWLKNREILMLLTEKPRNTYAAG